VKIYASNLRGQQRQDSATSEMVLEIMALLMLVCLATVLVRMLQPRRPARAAARRVGYTATPDNLRLPVLGLLGNKILYWYA
jgi:hypothetical protein